MGQLLKFGQVIADLNIQRADVAVGYTGYCVLLDQRVLAKQVVFVDRFGFVEVGADDVQRFRKVPMTYYLMLAARLTTDPHGRLYGDDITVEYLRMSRSQYQDFQRSVTANPTASAVMLTKEKRVDKNGKDVSGVKFMAAQLELSPAIQQKLELLKANPATMDSLFAQVDTLMGVPVSAYDEWLVNQRQEGVAPAGAAGAPAGSIPQQPYGGGSGYPAPAYGGQTPVQPYGGPALPPQHGGGVSAPQIPGSQPYGRGPAPVAGRPAVGTVPPAAGGSSIPYGGSAPAPAPVAAPAAAPAVDDWGVSGFDNEFDGQGGF